MQALYTVVVFVFVIGVLATVGLRALRGHAARAAQGSVPRPAHGKRHREPASSTNGSLDSRADEAAHRARDHELLARGDHEHAAGAPARRSSQSGRRAGCASGSSSTPRNPSRPQIRSRTSGEPSPMPAGEDERVEAAERDRHRADRGRDAVGEDVERERGRRRRRGLELAHVAASRPTSAEQARLVLERVVELVDATSPRSRSR